MPKALDIELIILLPNDRFGLIASFHEPTLMRCFSVPHRFFYASFVSFPVLHFFGKPSGTVRDASPVPVPCATHIHPPRDFPPAAPVALYSSFNSPIFCLHSFKIALVLKKSFPKVLPLSQKCVPLHSLSEREAQATSEWIFDRLRTANKTRQR